ncbi:cellulase family glycosylhydrolase [Lysobacter sp. Root983]|uniref:cellulase family glycosylhydrolase n=1 Tax=Lysobacter sp. Root983 TaxID=1736613 RepID=UPI000708983B|nr:cellulase family glycosylhydrolase [Lysobacter sp. Root983]KRD73417.1 hypothetical protein ASE43_18685 [Lysobacter sp. Root983]
MSHSIDSTTSPRRRSHRHALAAALLLACISPMAMATGNDTPGFGFNYWPQDYRGCQELTDATWPAAQKAIAADLDLMKSLGVDVLRLSLYMETSGYSPGNSPVPDMCKYLPNFLDLIEGAGLKVIVAFSNTYLGFDHANNRYYWQAPIYGFVTTPPTTGYWQFLEHSKEWIGTMVELTRDSGSILYYDIQNEYDSTIPDIDYYFRTMYGEIPAGKRGISILNTPHDIKPVGGDNWKSIPSQLHVLEDTLSYVDFHSYPQVPKHTCPLHWDIENVSDNMRSAFGANTTIVMGEFGRRAIGQNDPNPDIGAYLNNCTPPNTPNERHWDEPSQRIAELDLIARAANKGIPYYLHWMLWDHTPKPETPPGPSTDPAKLQVYGYGYSPHAPKDVLGALAEQRGLIPNADFENAPQVGQLPQLWDKGSWGPSNNAPPVLLFVSGGANTGEAATRDHYARLQAQQACATCVIWMQADAFDIGPGKRLHFNAYLRSNLDQVQMKLVQYDANWNVLATYAAPAVTLTGWSWNNYMVRAHALDPPNASASLSTTTVAGTARVILTIGGTPAAAPAILDVDTVSVAAD